MVTVLVLSSVTPFTVTFALMMTVPLADVGAVYNPLLLIEPGPHGCTTAESQLTDQLVDWFVITRLICYTAATENCC